MLGNRWLIMKRFIILIIVVLCLCGCKEKECKRSHLEDSVCVGYTTIYSNGKVVSAPYWYQCVKTVCDEYVK